MSKSLQIDIFAVLSGMTAMTVQIFLTREFMAVFYGNELVIGLILASWLFWVAAGSRAGNSLFSRDTQSTDKRFFHLHLLTLVGVFFSFQMTFEVRTILRVPFGELLSFADVTLYAWACLAVPCFLLGLQFSFLAYRSQFDDEAVGDPAARIYIRESTGGLLAGLIVSLILIRWLTNFSGILVLSAFTFAVLFFSTRRIWPAVLALLCLIFLVSPVSRAFESAKRSSYWRSVAENMRLVDWRESRFGRLSVVEQAGQNILYVNGSKQTSLPDRVESQTLASLVITQHRRPRTLLLIGGGLGGLAPELARFRDVSVDYAELEKEAYTLAGTTHDSTDRRLWRAENLTTLFVDGRYYLKNTAKKYDMILIDIGNPTSAVSNRFYTVDFFRLAKLRLAPGGVLVLCNIASAENYIGPEIQALNSAIYFTLKQVWSHILMIPGDVVHFFATDDTSALATDTYTLSERYSALGVSHDYFYPQMFIHFLAEERLDFLEKSLSSAPVKRINRDFHPISYFFDFLLWNKLVRGQSGWLQRVGDIRIGVLYALLIFAIAVWIAASHLLRGKSALLSGLVILTGISGFTGMVLNIVLVLAFQTIFGYIYAWIGLTLAAFMVGLVAGSWLVNRNMSRLSPVRILGSILTAQLLMCAGLLPVLGVLLDSPSLPLFFLLVFLSGALVGGVFPIVNALYTKKLGKRRVGTLYAADILGGSFGSLVLSGFLIPLFGFLHTLMLTAALVAGALVFLGTCMRRS